MSFRQVLRVLVCTVVIAPVLARGRGAGTLSRALTIWSAADRDRDGRITRTESASFPIDDASFRRADVDPDGTWSREEFLRFYRRCVIASSEEVGVDLDAEIARLCAMQRARAIEEARRCGPQRRPSKAVRTP
jgi:hypothetical protein